MKKYTYTIIFGLLAAIGYFVAQPSIQLGALSVLKPTQGGTGVGSATAGDVTKCLKVSDDSPFTFELGTCGTGGSSLNATSTEPLMASWFVATSTTNASVFPYASTTALSADIFLGTPSGSGYNALYLIPQGVNGSIMTAKDSNNEFDRYDFVTGASFYEYLLAGSSFLRLRETSGTKEMLIQLNANSYLNTTGNFGLGTTSPYAKLSVVGEVVASHFTATTTANSSLSGTLTLGGNTVKAERYPVFGVATSTTWTATTTVYLAPATVAQTWNTIRCETDAGFIGVSVYDGTNRMNYFEASTTIGTISLTSNNSFTAGESRRVDFGTTTTATTKNISCSAIYTIN